ncbi:hypothetical protein EO763_15695 [Pectobacterium odoriferum]|nr:hypothetical protein EO763_15695 [Pectobacterium odoriferum]
MRDILSLTGGQPLAGQIRSRRICPSLAACLKLELFRVYAPIALAIHSPRTGFYRHVWRDIARHRQYR